MVIKILFGALVFFVAQSLVLPAKSFAQKKTTTRPSSSLSSSKPRSPSPASRSFYFGSASYIWWQEDVDLVSPSGRKTTLITNSHAPCFGGGYFKRVVGWDFSLSGCVFYGSSDISALSGPPNYSQRTVETMGLFLGPGVHYRPFSGQVSVGVVVPGFLRYADWTSTDTGYTVEPKMRISGGALLDTQWRLRRVVVHQRLGPVVNVGWVWSLGLDYIF